MANFVDVARRARELCGDAPFERAGSGWHSMFGTHKRVAMTGEEGDLEGDAIAENSTQNDERTRVGHSIRSALNPDSLGLNLPTFPWTNFNQIRPKCRHRCPIRGCQVSLLWHLAFTSYAQSIFRGV